MAQPRLAVAEAFSKTSQAAACKILKTDIFNQGDDVVAARYAHLSAEFDKYTDRVAGIVANHEVDVSGYGPAEWLTAANGGKVGYAAPEEEILAAFQRRWRQRLDVVEGLGKQLERMPPELPSKKRTQLRSPYKRAIREALITLGLTATAQQVATWIAEHLENTQFPHVAKRYGERQDLGYLYRNNAQFRGQFDRDVTDIRTMLKS